MTRRLLGVAGLTLLGSSLSAQSGMPYDARALEDLHRGRTDARYKLPKIKPIGVRPRIVNKPSSQPAEGPLARIPLQDWRFSHPAPAMLISINIGSLLQSPLLTALFASSGTTTADIEKARTALSDVGQVLISVSRKGALIMAKGNIDGAFGAYLKAGTQMQARRLDAITMLIGDPHSLDLAGVRMRAKFAATTANALQQTATAEALKYDAWIGIDPRYMAAAASALGADLTPEWSALANLRGLSAGLYLRDQVRLEASLDAPTPALAERMRASYEAKRKDGQAWLSTEGAKVSYIEILDASRLKTAPGFDSQKIAALIHALAASAPAPQSVLSRPTGGAIVIQGLSK